MAMRSPCHARHLALLATAAFLLRSEPVFTAATVPPGFVDEVVTTGLNLPIGFTFLPDGRVLIAEKAGVVRVVKNGMALATPLIDLHTQVNDYWDRGMLGIAADPNFAGNGFIYLYFVYENNAADYSGPKTSRLIRVTAVGDVASPTSAVVLLGSSVGAGCDSFPVSADCIPMNSPSHGGGSIRFAADGNLFVSTGDGASFQVVDDLALRAQSLNSLAGKILRIAPNGVGLSDNPFWNGDPTSPRSKIWAYGFRNPFRTSINPTTNRLLVGDVGWDSYEEIDVAERGANFGWPCYEGPSQQPGYAGKSVCQTLYASATTPRMPLVWWAHDGTGAAALGGTFYTGTAFPSAYQGAYFFGDYARGYFSYLKVDAADNLNSTPADFADNIAGPVELRQGSDGSLYYIAINTNELRRIRFSGTVDSPYISSRSWTSATNGWGPVERDMSNGEQAAGDGRVLTLNGQTYPRGLGTHANSDVRYALVGQCTTFETDVGVDDETGSLGSVVFQVWADGAKLYDSGIMTSQTATRHALVDVTGRQELSLQVSDAGDGISSDHADWAGATLSCGSTAPTISAVSARNITATSASIAWTTNVPADAQVEYGTTTQYGSQTIRQTALTTSHEESLTGLSPSTQHHYRVRSRDAAGIEAVSADFTFVTLATGSSAQSLSDLSWTTATNGWGPVERDMSNGEQAAGDGRVLTLNGKTYSRGLGVHANSDVRYALGGQCTTFQSDVGVDDETGIAGSVVFQVWLDGVKEYDSGVMTGQTATRQAVVDVTGRQELALRVTDAGDGNVSDHADWAGATLACGSTAPTISAVSARNVTSTSVSIAWTTNVPADAQVEYGTTTQYGSQTVRQTALTTAHDVSLTGLTPSTQYHYRVHSRNAAGVEAISPDFTVVTLGSSNPALYLSDLSWTSMINGWGPAERDRSNGEAGTNDGHPITLNGVVYAKGLGVHAPSELRYTLPAGCSTFVADVGVDDEVGSAGSVVFQVWVDANKVLETPVLRGTSATVAVNQAVIGTELRLVVTDSGDGNASDHADWANARLLCSGSASNPPVATISSPDPTVKYKVGDVITFAGSATDPEDGTLPSSALVWSIEIRHCPGGLCHIHPLISATGSGGSFTIPDHGDDSVIDITLTATDSAGMTGKVTETLLPLTVQVTLATAPAGLSIVHGGVSVTAPITYAGVVGSTQTISTPSPQNGLTFTGWSDGGAQSHNIVVGTSNMSFTATFADRTGPQISSVSAATTSTSATIKWVTNEGADGQVQYGLTTAYGSTTPRVDTFTTAHSVVITGLGSQTTYSYRVLSRDAAGNLTTSGNFTLKTKR